MTDRKHKNKDFFILNLGDYTIIPDTIPPLLRSLPYETFSVPPRIDATLKILAKPGYNDLAIKGIHFG